MAHLSAITSKHRPDFIVEGRGGGGGAVPVTFNGGGSSPPTRLHPHGLSPCQVAHKFATATAPSDVCDSGQG